MSYPDSSSDPVEPSTPAHTPVVTGLQRSPPGQTTLTPEVTSVNQQPQSLSQAELSPNAKPDTDLNYNVFPDSSSLWSTKAQSPSPCHSIQLPH